MFLNPILDLLALVSSSLSHLTPYRVNFPQKGSTVYQDHTTIYRVQGMRPEYFAAPEAREGLL